MLIKNVKAHQNVAIVDVEISELRVVDKFSPAEMRRLGGFEGQLKAYEWILPALEELEKSASDESFWDDASSMNTEGATFALNTYVSGIRNQVRRLYGLDEGLHGVADYLETVLDALNTFAKSQKDLPRWKPSMAHMDYLRHHDAEDGLDLGEAPERGDKEGNE
jgi:hypothetical protein